jgi:hypothetical protein
LKKRRNTPGPTGTEGEQVIPAAVRRPNIMLVLDDDRMGEGYTDLVEVIEKANSPRSPLYGYCSQLDGWVW